jgi:hypothetical protein
LSVQRYVACNESGQLPMVLHFAAIRTANSLQISLAPRISGLRGGPASPTTRTVAKPCILAAADSSQTHTSLHLFSCMVGYSPCGTASTASDLALVILLPTLRFCRMDRFVASSRADTSTRLEAKRPKCKLLHLIVGFYFTS